MDEYEIIRIEDKSKYLIQMLGEIPENSPYGCCKFLKKFNSQEMEKKQTRQREKEKGENSNKKNMMSQIEKELSKYRAGVVFVEKEGEIVLG